MMQSTHTNRINSGMGHCALPKRQLQTDLGCVLTIPRAAVSHVLTTWQCVPRGQAYSHAASPSPTQVEIHLRTQCVSWVC